ncbi:hypothetical protein P389DRAFT_95064 [Cystobasidium minutum MCA 4210]|uniref:uncharacterized protein n=1 Tax=Cystobasidium minutum MCA 4210 TaxID=1397322 RepID=UPI0034CDBCF3|eukprot:jgi/Rhomi1/95064/CE95063_2822
MKLLTATLGLAAFLAGARASIYCSCDSVAIQNNDLTVQYAAVGDPDGYQTEQDPDDMHCSALCDTTPGCNVYDIEASEVEGAYSRCYLGRVSGKLDTVLTFPPGEFTIAYKGSCESEDHDHLPHERCLNYYSAAGPSQDASSARRRSEQKAACDMC